MKRLLLSALGLVLLMGSCGELRDPEAVSPLFFFDLALIDELHDAALTGSEARVGLFWIVDNVYREPGTVDGPEVVAWDLGPAGFPTGFPVSLDALPPESVLTHRVHAAAPHGDTWPLGAAIALAVPAVYLDHDGDGVPHVASPGDPEAVDEILAVDETDTVLWIEGEPPLLDVASGSLARGYQLATASACLVRLTPDSECAAGGPSPATLLEPGAVLTLPAAESEVAEALLCEAPGAPYVEIPTAPVGDFEEPHGPWRCGPDGETVTVRVSACSIERYDAATADEESGWPCFGTVCGDLPEAPLCAAELLATGLDPEGLLAADGGHVFWTRESPPEVWHLAPGAASAESLASPDKDKAFSTLVARDGRLFATLGSNVFTWRADDGSSSNHSLKNEVFDLLPLGDDSVVYLLEEGVFRYDFSKGDEPTELATDLDGATRIMVDGDHVYWWSATSRLLRRVALDGSHESEIVAGGKSSKKNWLPIGVHDGWFYLRSTEDTGGIGAMSVAEDLQVDLVTAVQAGAALVSSEGLLWSDEVDGTLARADLDGDDARVIHRDEHTGDQPVATDGEWLYSVRAGGDLVRAPLAH